MGFAVPVDWIFEQVPQTSTASVGAQWREPSAREAGGGRGWCSWSFLTILVRPSCILQTGGIGIAPEPIKDDCVSIS